MKDEITRSFLLMSKRSIHESEQRKRDDELEEGIISRP
jgi:hypothetical protein